MFSSSVRRVASSTAPPTSIISSLPRAQAATSHLSRSCHQRRLSSSKPSSPADGPKGVAKAQVVPAPAEPEKKTRRKAKQVAANSTVRGRDQSLRHFPSVPSTQHISPVQISASAFFSLHRPISLTNCFPKAVTDEAFAAIFTPRTRANKPTEVINTLSNTLKNIDSVAGRLEHVKLGGQQEIWNAETDEVRAAITADSYKKAEDQALDNTPEDVATAFQQNLLSTRYRPFCPPPAPVPMNTDESLAAGAEAAETPEPQHRTYTAVLTIEESTDANGNVTYIAHSSPLISTPTTFLGRMQARQERYRAVRGEESDMLAISVKRQRKLKMKKHKYKKLMKRTRNLRRRIERS